MSLYADYVAEREGKLVIETDESFVCYSIDGDSLYIQDIYVVPAKRREHIGSLLADFVVKIAKEKGCKKVYGSVSTSAKGAHESMLALLAWGMRLMTCKNDLIFFVKDI